MSLEDLQAEVPDLLARARAIVAVLECAETCETASDFAVNLSEASDQIVALRFELAELRADL